MANLDRSKKLLVRVALVCGSTVSTLDGAQTLAMLDQNTQTVESLAAPAATEVSLPPTATPRSTVEAFHQAPSIILLRPQPSALDNVRSVSNAPANSAPDSPAILPPNPQEISAPAPVIVQQQQAPAVSSSSR